MSLDLKEAASKSVEVSGQKDIYAEFDQKCKRGEFDAIIAETERDYREGKVLRTLEPPEWETIARDAAKEWQRRNTAYASSSKPLWEIILDAIRKATSVGRAQRGPSALPVNSNPV